jgi:hypothetical protein
MSKSWGGIRIMCPRETTCLPADGCFSDLVSVSLTQNTKNMVAIKKVQHLKWILYDFERVSDCCLTPSEQSLSYIMARTSYILTRQ